MEAEVASIFLKQCLLKQNVKENYAEGNSATAKTDLLGMLVVWPSLDSVFQSY